MLLEERTVVNTLSKHCAKYKLHKETNDIIINDVWFKQKSWLMAIRNKLVCLVEARFDYKLKNLLICVYVNHAEDETPRLNHNGFITVTKIH